MPTDVIKHLAMLPHITIEKAKGLLDPLDKQNVPKVITMVQEMHTLRDLPMPENPSEERSGTQSISMQNSWDILSFHSLMWTKVFLNKFAPCLHMLISALPCI
jgi:hypothetical protein